MTQTAKAPGFVQIGNVFTNVLLRFGIRLKFSNYTLALMTIKGRKSGIPRTVPTAIVAQHGERYLTSPYGMVDWVKNLIAAREAELTHGGRIEVVNVYKLPEKEAALVLQESFRDGHPMRKFFGVADNSLEAFEENVKTHPVFRLESRAFRSVEKRSRLSGIQALRMFGSLAVLLALALGIATITRPDFLSAHMLMGLLVALVLLTLSLTAVFANGARLRGVSGIVLAFALPIVGHYHPTLLIGELHWVIQVVHVMMGVGAFFLMGSLSMAISKTA